jgi:DNA helicase HerA-like ATPase
VRAEGRPRRCLPRSDSPAAHPPPPSSLSGREDGRRGGEFPRRGVKVVDFSEVPSDVLPVVAGTFARLLYDVQFWQRPENRTPFTLVCDEAHLYLPVKDDADAVEKQALATFERIAKEGRKYGVSLVVVSQRPSDVSRTILSQCNNFLILRLTNDADQAVVRRLMPDSMAGLTEILPMLDTGEALILGDAVLLPTRIKMDKPTIQPTSGTRDFWKEWGSQRPDAKAITEAVETLRRQTRVND